MIAAFWIPWLALLAPVLLGSAAFVPASVANRRVRTMRGAALGLAATSFVLALIAAAGCAFFGKVALAAPDLGGISAGILIDALSATILVLISFLGLVIVRYANSYLAGDPNQGEFLKWLSATLASAMCIVLAGDLFVLTVAWIFTSRCLHHLLVFYPDRPAALRAARTKRIITRTGDLCLAAAVVMCVRAFGTTGFQEIFAALRSGVSPEAMGSVHLIAVLLMGGAVLKSAQFPFHSWLPETMETPTPVSALMHAGIVNAGGYLMIRMSPLVSLSEDTMRLLTVIGLVTTVYGGVVMMTQVSVKRVLAYSTVGQMGFMLLQCGLGCFSTAVLHIVAHSLYKAHAFLSSGSAVGVRTNLPASSAPGAMALSLMLRLAPAVGGVLVYVLFVRSIPGLPNAGSTILGLLVLIASGQWLAGFCRRGLSVGVIAWGIAGVCTLFTLYAALSAGFARMLGGVVAYGSTASTGPAWAVGIGLVFVGLVTLQVLWPFLQRFSSARAWYVHVYNGLYVSTLANSFAERFFPARDAARMAPAFCGPPGGIR